MPILNAIWRFSVTSAFLSARSFWISTADSTVSTTLVNSASILSPGDFPFYPLISIPEAIPWKNFPKSAYHAPDGTLFVLFGVYIETQRQIPIILFPKKGVLSTQLFSIDTQCQIPYISHHKKGVLINNLSTGAKK